MDIFLQIQNRPRPKQKVENLNRPITSKDFESEVYNLIQTHKRVKPNKFHKSCCNLKMNYIAN